MKIQIIIFSSLFIFASCGAKKESGEASSANQALEVKKTDNVEPKKPTKKVSSKFLAANQTFEIRKPEYNEMIEAVDVWATNYFIPEFEDGSGEFSLRDMKGKDLGPSLSKNDWCHSALEGSVKINFKDGVSKVYNYIGNTEEYQIDCSSLIPKHNVSKSKFKISKSEFGEGTSRYNLIPFRSLAADNTIFPLGSVIFIPAARGNKVELGPNESFIHDGYFFVSDVGGAIKDKHIDVFIGVKKSAPFFKWIKHKEDKTFKAYVITDEKIVAGLTKIHLKK